MATDPRRRRTEYVRLDETGPNGHPVYRVLLDGEDIGTVHRFLLYGSKWRASPYGWRAVLPDGKVVHHAAFTRHKAAWELLYARKARNHPS